MFSVTRKPFIILPFGSGKLSFFLAGSLHSVQKKSESSTFTSRLQRLRWREIGKRIESFLAVRLFPINVILTTAVDRSADFVEPSTIIVSPYKNVLRAVCHEVLHLILRRHGVHFLLQSSMGLLKHSKSINKYSAYQLEQGLVVALDCLIRGEREQRRYFANCEVGKLQWLYGRIKKYYPRGKINLRNLVRWYLKEILKY